MTTIDEFLFEILQPVGLLHLKPLSLEGMQRVNGRDESPKYFDPKSRLYFRVPKDQEVALRLATRLYALRRIPVLPEFKGVWIVQNENGGQFVGNQGRKAQDEEIRIALGMSAFGNRAMSEEDIH